MSGRDLQLTVAVAVVGFALCLFVHWLVHSPEQARPPVATRDTYVADAPAAVAERLKLPGMIEDEHHKELGKLAYSPRLKFLAAVPAIYAGSQFDRPVFIIDIWDLATGKRNDSLYLLQPVDYVGFTPDGLKLFYSTKDGMVLYNAVKRTDAVENLGPLLRWAQLTPTGTEFFAKGEEGIVTVWDADSVKPKRVLRPPDEARKGFKYIDWASLTLSPDERFLALGAGLCNKAIVVWDYKTAQVLTVLQHENSLDHLLFSKDGKYLFGGGNEVRDGGARGHAVLDIWDTKSWRMVREIEVDESSIRPVLFLPQKDMVLSIDDLRPPDVGRLTLFRTLINGYSLKTGERLVSYDTGLDLSGYCQSALYLEDYDAICIGGADGKMSFYAVDEILKKKTK